MNELFFVLHIIVLIFFLFLSYRIGKGALACFFALSNVFANLFVTQQISLFHRDVTATDAYTACGIISLNIIQEYFGKKTANNIISASTLMLLYFFIVGQIHLAYIPNAFDQTQMAFKGILSSTPRIILCSIGIAFLSQKIDCFLFTIVKRKFTSLSFLPRASLSFVISQSIDSLLFTYVAIGHLIKNREDVMLFSMMIKILSFGMGILIVSLGKQKLSLVPKEPESSIF